MATKPMNIIIVGLGGVGSHLKNPLCRFVETLKSNSSFLLIDGDTYEPKNVERQEFIDYGNKAQISAENLKKSFPGVDVSSYGKYVTKDNVEILIPEGSIVFCCVDNHASRKLLSDRISSLQDGVLISGGNDFSDGNVQIHIRESGVDKTPPITYLHPEIEFPKDKNPDEMSCDEAAAAGSPQLIFANFKVASEMLATFWSQVVNQSKPEARYTELYFDLVTGSQRPVKRKVEQ